MRHAWSTFMSNTFKVKGRSANYKLSEVIFLFSLNFLVSDQLGIVGNDSIKRRWLNTYLLMDGFFIYVSVPIKNCFNPFDIEENLTGNQLSFVGSNKQPELSDVYRISV